MEKFTGVEQSENVSGIPDHEQADLALSPVSRQEMEFELRAMREALGQSKPKETESLLPAPSETVPSRDWGEERQETMDRLRLTELRQKLDTFPAISSEPQTKISVDYPPLSTEDGEAGATAVEIKHVKYETCKNCEGRGRVLFGILPCPKCGGSGNAPALKQDWDNKISGNQRKAI